MAGASVPSDIELLRLEVATIWVTDGRGRLLREVSGAAGPLAVVASAAGAHEIHVSARLDDASVERLREVMARTRPLADPSAEPPAVRECARILEAAAPPVEVSGGPSYVASGSEAFESDVEVLTSEYRTLGRPPPPPDQSGWAEGEWRDLMEGRLGPWALAFEGGAAVSVCHCSRLNDRACEAGVWTHPAHRGRGYAAAVTGAWARLVARTGRVVFYSTSSDNRSSQRVAARLRLREIGWTWRLRPRSGRGRPTG